ncbi:MAG: stage IV sporulation protein A [Clostridia bacterium]
MEKLSIYEDISTRTNGDIYLGVVGPVRTGKSTFITKFMENLVLPNINNKNTRDRAIDELPQSANGKTIMTTQPKFVPNEAVGVKIAGKVKMNVRLIDCVGYLVEGAIGHIENNMPRLVRTPWSASPLPFEEAAELGTKKVIEEHSTIAVLVTTDGTISDIPRSSYIKAEERVAKELKENNKPFVVIVNSKDPQSESAQKLASALSKKYEASAIALDVTQLDENGIQTIFSLLLEEFPIESVQIKMPKWMQALSFEDEIIKSIASESTRFCESITKIGEIDANAKIFEESENFEPLGVESIVLGEGKVYFELKPKPALFYKVLTSQCGQEISDDYHLVSYIKRLAHCKVEYDKIKTALNQVAETGYGVVVPTMDDMMLEDPQIVKQGSRFGVKLKASAPSLHIMKVDIETEVNPLVGTEQQSEELVKFMMSEFENNPKAIWDSNIFGKSLSSLVNEGISNKLAIMPMDAQRKMRKTLGRIVNEGKGGVICILL